MMISVSYLGWVNLETDTLEQMTISHRRHSSVTIKIVSGEFIFTLLLAWLIILLFNLCRLTSALPCKGLTGTLVETVQALVRVCQDNAKPCLRHILQFLRNLYPHFKL